MCHSLLVISYFSFSDAKWTLVWTHCIHNLFTSQSRFVGYVLPMRPTCAPRVFADFALRPVCGRRFFQDNGEGFDAVSEIVGVDQPPDHVRSVGSSFFEYALEFVGSFGVG